MEMNLCSIFPTHLAKETVQRWERVDKNGYVVPVVAARWSVARSASAISGTLPRSASAMNLERDFSPGTNPFNEGGDVTDLQETWRFASGNHGEKQISYALYRSNSQSRSRHLLLRR